MQLPLVKVLQANGYTTFVLDEDGSASCFRVSAGAVCDVQNVAACEEVISVLPNIQIIMTNCSDVAQSTVASLSKKRNLNAISEECARSTTDKWEMKKALLKHGLPTASASLITSIMEVEEGKNDFPAVIKPRHGSGSRSVRYLHDQESFLTYEFDFAVDTYLLEHFVQGEELAIDGFTIDGHIYGLTVSEKTRTNLPYLSDIELFVREVDVDKDKQVLELAAQTISATGMDNCPFHIEILASSRELNVVECAARGPGFNVFNELIPSVTGVDVLQTAVNLAAGNKHLAYINKKCKCALLSFPEFGIGTVSSINGWVFQQNGSSLNLLFAVGDVISEVVDGHTRQAVTIAYGNSMIECEKIADSLCSLVNISFENEK